MHKEALKSIGRIFIGCFFMWHVFVFGVGGISNTMEFSYSKTLRENVFYKVDWYTKMLDQNQQNWGFFGFVPNAIVRFTFETDNNGIEEYKLTDWPYIGRQTEFNMLRTIASKTDSYVSERKRYLKDYCRKRNIHGQEVRLGKKYAYLPREEDMNNFDWNSWNPQWETYQMDSIYCAR